jgi:hypothetical protein
MQMLARTLHTAVSLQCNGKVILELQVVEHTLSQCPGGA